MAHLIASAIRPVFSGHLPQVKQDGDPCALRLIVVFQIQLYDEEISVPSPELQREIFISLSKNGHLHFQL